MYKLLLCWRYLHTRYLALVCIVSVMLGVATLIVVNSVMSGFSTKLRDRLHGLLSDVLIEARDFDGFPDAQGKMARIRTSPIGQYVEAMTPTVEVFAMMQYPLNGSVVTKPVRLIGVDPESRTAVGGFAEYVKDRQGEPTAANFELAPDAIKRYQSRQHPPSPPPVFAEPDRAPLDAPPPPEPWEQPRRLPRGVILGKALVSFRDPRSTPEAPLPNIYVVEPGDTVLLTTVSGAKLAPAFDHFIVASYFKSEMSEYDGNYVFVPIDYLQQLRSMEDRVTSIQIKLKDFDKAPEVVDQLHKMFPSQLYLVQTWQDKQGPLLSAIAVERGILNVLLFLIVGVAGFGILAIFSMIVVEKTRDIGILKALGASNRGVMQIFMSYGLLLGIVGAGLGTAFGLWMTFNLNEIEQVLSSLTGMEVFPRNVYYFDKIPINIQPWMVVLVNAGSVAIAVLFSILPALRAAMLHPVKALRYE